jgi:hypothetical protein
MVCIREWPNRGYSQRLKLATVGVLQYQHSFSRLFKEICEESTCNDIEFDSDGSWHPIGSRDGKSTVGNPLPYKWKTERLRNRVIAHTWLMTHSFPGGRFEGSLLCFHHYVLQRVCSMYMWCVQYVHVVCATCTCGVCNMYMWCVQHVYVVCVMYVQYYSVSYLGNMYVMCVLHVDVSGCSTCITCHTGLSIMGGYYVQKSKLPIKCPGCRGSWPSSVSCCVTYI